MASRERLVVVDVETTGLSPARHEIIQVALVGLDPASLAETWSFCAYAAPRWPDRADPEALAVNGLSAEDWRDAEPVAEVAREIAAAGYLAGATLVGHNVQFDEAFLRAELTRAVGPEACRWGHRRVDTSSLAFPLEHHGEVERRSLERLCAALGVVNRRPHDAMSDARATAEVLRRLVARMGPPAPRAVAA